MDSDPASGGLDERGVGTIQFVLASALAMVLFLALANLVVVQYGRGALRSAVEQGARAGSVGGVAMCETRGREVIADLIGGRMSDDATLTCALDETDVVASISVTFQSWTPLTPDFSFTTSARSVGEP